MPPDDQTLALLHEIRDLQKQQLAMMKENQEGNQFDKKMDMAKMVMRVVFNVLVVVFVIGAVWYYYSSISKSGLI